MILITFFIIIDTVSQGRIGELIRKYIFPHREQIIGNFLCKVGGFIVQPVIKGTTVPYPSGVDDVAVPIAMTMFITWLFLKRAIKSWKWLLFSIIITWVISFFIYKGVGLLMVFIAETQYGMENCVEILDLGLIELPYEKFNPIYILGTLFAAYAFIAFLYEIWKRKKK